MATATAPTADLLTADGRRSRRSLRDRIYWGLCILAFLFIIAPTVSVLVSVVRQAAPTLGWHLLTKDTQAGGLKNAIEGTVLLLVGVLVVAGTVGVAAGIWLAEYAPPRLGGVLRFLSEILAGIPSIVIGFVGYFALVNGLHWHYSLLAALLALSALVLPYVVKTTEVAIRSVPSALGEASAALGLPKGTAVGRILLPTALPGIVSGLVVALAISTGETAPLLFTAKNSPSAPVIGPHMFLHNPLDYLTYEIYSNTSQPGAAAHAAAGAAAFVTMAILLVLIIVGRVIATRARRRTDRMAL